jgi:hypothetical protein
LIFVGGGGGVDARECQVDRGDRHVGGCNDRVRV